MAQNRAIPLNCQKKKLQCLYSRLIDNICVKNSQLICYMRIQPTSKSTEYRVKISLKFKCTPRVWLIKPKEIAKYDGKEPHHTYKTRDKDGHVELCVFFPQKDEWNDQKLLADTFIPWVVTWLSAYEYWQITGTWIYPESNDLNKKI